MVEKYTTKDLLIIDNFIDDPDVYLDICKHTKFYNKGINTIDGVSLYEDQSNIPNGLWSGLRSGHLEYIAPKEYRQLAQKICHSLSNTPLQLDGYIVDMFFHYGPGIIPNNDSWWHIDKDYKVAGVIYLNKVLPADTGFGTKIILGKENVFVAENRFNRLVLYNSSLMHRPEACFGTTADDARLTLTIFLDGP